MKLEPRDKALLDFKRDRPLAHAVIFQGVRHKNKTPPFHREIILDFHSPKIAQLCDIVFRGGAKSTIAEEAICIEAGLREFRHCFIVGASLDKACERLHAIRRIIEKNEVFRHVFGDLVGKPWTDERIETPTGITIMAMGRGQAIRGTKAEDIRPDLMLIDDIEDRQSISTPEGRKKVADWMFDELLPAGDVDMRVRMLANDMHPECIANELEKPGSGFLVKRYPWEYLDAQGERQATWPDRFPLSYIDQRRDQFYSQGKADEYNANYLCRSRSPEDKPFRRDMFRHAGEKGVPAVKVTWQPIYAMIDPARSVKETAATTGFAAWFRVGTRLVVVESWAKRMLPADMIDALFAFNEQYRPVKIGFEKTGLNEWAMQPIRLEQAKRRIMLPIEPMDAPRDKMGFIRGLQFSMIAGETIFAKPLPDLEAQLLGFPSGHIDAPNALAYSQKLGAGVPMYEDFAETHVRDALPELGDRQCWLAMNATATLTTAVLVQYIDGTLRILADWVRDGEPGAVAGDIVMEANLETARPPGLAAGPQHFERYGNLGLVQACRRIPAEVRRAGLPLAGRNEGRNLLRKVSRGLPAFLVSGRARWTLNALAGGYCRKVRNGQVVDEAEDGPYKVLVEGLESFLAMMHSYVPEGAEGPANATAADGRPYISALARRRG